MAAAPSSAPPIYLPHGRNQVEDRQLTGLHLFGQPRADDVGRRYRADSGHAHPHDDGVNGEKGTAVGRQGKGRKGKGHGKDAHAHGQAVGAVAIGKTAQDGAEHGGQAHDRHDDAGLGCAARSLRDVGRNQQRHEGRKAGADGQVGDHPPFEAARELKKMCRLALATFISILGRLPLAR